MQSRDTALRSFEVFVNEAFVFIVVAVVVAGRDDGVVAGVAVVTVVAGRYCR